MELQKAMDSESVIQALLAAYGGVDRLMSELLQKERGCKNPVSEEQLKRLGEHLRDIAPVAPMTITPQLTEVRPQSLECDVVRFQNNKGQKTVKKIVCL